MHSLPSTILRGENGNEKSPAPYRRRRCCPAVDRLQRTNNAAIRHATTTRFAAPHRILAGHPGTCTIHLIRGLGQTLTNTLSPRCRHERQRDTHTINDDHTGNHR